jgi:hypothetical protein
VYLEEFWKWAEQNKAFLDFSKFEENDLGIEPGWAKTKRREDVERARRYITTPWSTLEDDELKHLLKQHKYTFPEISKKLRRTEGAVQRRINDLGLKERPVKVENHTLWTDEEYTLLTEMIKSGSAYESMSEQLGKSTKAIRRRVYRMYLTENLDLIRGMMGAGTWGDGRPERKIKHYLHMQIEEKHECKDLLSILAGNLKTRAKELSGVRDEYAEYWQKDLCRHWSDIKGCTARENNCDSCTSFARIQEQICRRCGNSFFERQKADICSRCRQMRKWQAEKKWAVLDKKRARNNERKER